MDERRAESFTSAERRLARSDAARWVVTLEDCTADEAASFAAWLKCSPLNVEEYLLASATWNAVAERRTEQQVSIEAIIAEARSASAATNVISLAEATPSRLPAQEEQTSERCAPQPRSRPVRKYLLFAVAASAFTMFGYLLHGHLVGLRPSAYVTGVGEQRNVVLSDGSLVFMSGRSRMDVRFTAASRTVELAAGEAIFNVYHDAKRPFRVVTGDATVKAIGTSFNVERLPERTLISVLEGKVAVAAQYARGTAPDTGQAGVATRNIDLIAGEQASIATAGKYLRVKHDASMQSVAAWRARRLEFKGDRLEDIVARFSRYHGQRIDLADEKARDKRISGSFQADDPLSFLQFLETIEDLSVRRKGDDFIVSTRS